MNGDQISGRAPPGYEGAARGGAALFENIIGGNAPLNNSPRPTLQARRAAEARRLRRQRYAARIRTLGERVLFEIFDHIAGRFGLEDEVDHLLDRYADLDLDLLRTLGAGKLSAPPIRQVR
jgi:hypothetical protein